MTKKGITLLDERTKALHEVIEKHLEEIGVDVNALERRIDDGLQGDILKIFTKSIYGHLTAINIASELINNSGSREQAEE
jgi:hypothetical protein